MPTLIHLTTFAETRGSLTVMEKGVPFQIRRIFYTYNVPVGTIRGGHGHRRVRLALMAPAGTCEVSGFTDAGAPWSFILDDPSACLVLEPGDWHQMRFLKPGTVLLTAASEDYDPADYVHERPH